MNYCGVNETYENLIKNFLSEGYNFIFYNELFESHNQVISRHDVDFDCSLAYKMALLEKELEIKSTYFFLLRNSSYNLLSDSNSKIVKDIQKLGHKAGLHFDPKIYEDENILDGFAQEVEIFTKYFGGVDIVSIHRPNNFLSDNNQLLNGIEHAYMDKYFKNIKYIADSMGMWRYGHPFEAEEFKAHKTIQLLTHPIWWTMEGSSNIDKVKNYIRYHQKALEEHIAQNCKPYKEFLDNITS